MASGPQAYGTVARLFHWTVAVLVLLQVPAGIGMTSEPLGAYADPLFIFHKGLGALLLGLVLARVGWRATHRAPLRAVTRAPPVCTKRRRREAPGLETVLLSAGSHPLQPGGDLVQ